MRDLAAEICLDRRYNIGWDWSCHLLTIHHLRELWVVRSTRQCHHCLYGAHGEIVDEDAGSFFVRDRWQTLPKQSLDRALELVKDSFLSTDDVTHEAQFPSLGLRLLGWWWRRRLLIVDWGCWIVLLTNLRMLLLISTGLLREQLIEENLNTMLGVLWLDLLTAFLR